MAKIEPAVTQLLYGVPNGTSYIDIAKDLSLVNRRMYRQGYTYVVQDVQVAIPAGSRPSDISYVQLSTSGNSWIVHNAWRKGFAAWRRQVREVENATGIKAGTWDDFKVYLDDTHEDGTTLTPVAADGASYSTGEWSYSALVFDDDGTERDLKMHLIGSSNLADTNEESGIGLINEYQESRSIVKGDDPATPAGASDTIYAKLMGTDEMTDRVVDNVESANDNPPYDLDDYPGGAVNADAAVPVRWIMTSAAQGIGIGAGFIAPCGLLKITTSELALNDTLDLTASDASTIDAPGPTSVYSEGSASLIFMILTLAPGPYRGVLAAPMGQ
jgi:hypothetical protein